MKILGISGSLRRFSHNTQLLQTAAEMSGAFGAEVSITDLSKIPMYNADVEAEGLPESVSHLKAQVESADAVLFATPEYNFSVSGVLKNAIDWLSRPAFRSCLTGKPCGIVSASAAPQGGARSQLHLRTVLGATLSPVFPSPDYLIPSAHEAFDEDGVLQHDRARARLERYLESFTDWAGKQASPE